MLSVSETGKYVACYSCQACRFDVTREASYDGAEGLFHMFSYRLQNSLKLEQNISVKRGLINGSMGHRISTSEIQERSNER